ncbi:hypothetical protein C7271_21095 [filamentous cyanobacterium CCP5]|nr:hypothetical protein C7271_21095 [filamentous cyanobacterium CCP5]
MLLLGLNLWGIAGGANASSSGDSAPHLFGRSSVEDTASPTYVIFQIYQQQVVGAFYQRFSSFDCFYGRVTPTHLDLTIIDSFSSTAHAYAVATMPATSVVAQRANTPLPVQPVGYHRVQQIHDADLQVLNTCLTHYPL